MYMLILPPLLLQLRDQLGVSLPELTFLMTVSYFLFGIMALPGGFLADKWSYKAVLVMFFIGTPAAACIVGSARSVLSLGIGLALLGTFASVYHPSGLALISHSVRERGKALGLHGMAGNLGLAFSPIIAGSLALRFSWRHSYYFLSVPGFIAGIVFILISRLVLKDTWYLTVGEGRKLKLAAPSVQHPGSSTQRPAERSEQRFTLWAIILLYTAMALVGFCYRGTVTMLPTYLGRFSIGLEFQSDLDNETVSEGLLQGFQNNKTELSQSTTISIKEPGM
jgi:MFS family permease